MHAPSLPDVRRRAGLALAILVMALALPLAACGKKAEPGPPPGVPNTYPRSYPRD